MATSKLKKLSIPRAHIRLMQLVVDRLHATGKWPRSRDLQIAFMPGDFCSVIEEIAPQFLFSRGQLSDSNSETSLSIEGVAICARNKQLISLFIRALQFCVRAYKVNPTSPLVSLAQLQQQPEFVGHRAMTAFSLLLVCPRIFSRSSFSSDQTPTEIELRPGILKFDHVTNIGQYLAIVRVLEEPTISKNSNSTKVVLERIKKAWKQITYVAGGIAAILGIYIAMRDISFPTTSPNDPARMSDIDTTHLQRFSRQLAYGEVGNAKAMFVEARNSWRDPGPLPPLLDLESKLISVFEGPLHWDSYSLTDREILRDKLKQCSYHPLRRESIILLNYRLPANSAKAVLYFIPQDDSLQSPFVRFLAAREVGEANVRWTLQTLSSVVDSAREEQCTSLQVTAMAWLSHYYRTSGDSVAARNTIDSALAIVVKSGAFRDDVFRPLKVRVHGERLAVLRKFSIDSTEALSERSTLTQIVNEIGRDLNSLYDAAAIANAYFWIGLDFKNQADYCEAAPWFKRCREICNEFKSSDEPEITLRLEYPYIYAMSYLHEAGSKLECSVDDDSLYSILNYARELVSDLNCKSEFESEGALCELYFSVFYCRSANRESAQKYFNATSKLRSSILADGRSFGFEEDWLRIKQKYNLKYE